MPSGPKRVLLALAVASAPAGPSCVLAESLRGARRRCGANRRRESESAFPPCQTAILLQSLKYTIDHSGSVAFGAVSSTHPRQCSSLIWHVRGARWQLAGMDARRRACAR
eukprot:2884031-Pleurochrysis_carterae.AAC.5